MADENRTSSRLVTLLEQLEKSPHAFDFYQAVRRLDCAFPDRPPTGHSSRVADDPVRFGQEPTMAFAPATLQSVERPAARPPRLIQRFFGLLGPQGPLPLHITEFVRERVRNFEDLTLSRFFDVFHHRMTTFFYRAWSRVRPTTSFDRKSGDRFGEYVASIFGHGMRSCAGRDAFPDISKRHFAGLLACQTRHLDGLLAILRGYFGLPVRIEEFVGQWIELPPGSRCMLGSSASALGVDTTVGSHVWDCQQKFRVIFGPLSLQDYYRMLPGGSELSSDARPNESGHAAASGDSPVRPTVGRPTGRRASLDRLVAAVRTYVGDELQFDLQMVLKRQETPPLGLGTVGRLGWSSWLLSEPIPHDPNDLVLDAAQLPRNVERIEFQYRGSWNGEILGETHDEQFIVATIDPQTQEVVTDKSVN